jgi:hypothetical protein
MTPEQAAARATGAITPQAVGPRLTIVVAVLAAAVMFAVGLFAGTLAARAVGAPGSASAVAGYAVGGAFAVFSAQGSVRRMVRRRARG